MSVDDVEAQVAAKIAAVTTLLTDAQDQVPEFLQTVNEISASRPSFITPTYPSLPVTNITVSAKAPTAPNIQEEINDVTAADPEAFSPSGRESAIGEIPQTYLDWVPNIATLAAEEDKFLGEYSPTLVAAMTAKLLNDIQNGGTGLSTAVQQAIIDAQAERDAQIFRDARDKVLSIWSTTGMEIPDNVLNAQIQELIKKEADLKTDRSRQITVDTFKLADANTKWAVEQGIILESKLMELFNQSADRAIKYVLSKLELSATVFRTLVEAYKSQADVALADAQITNATQKTELDAYTAKLAYLDTRAKVGLGKIDALLKKYGVDMERYRTDASVSEAQGRINLAQAERDTQNILWMFKAGLDALQQNLVTSEHNIQIRATAAQGTAQILANYLASITNSLNAGLNMTASYSSSKNS